MNDDHDGVKLCFALHRFRSDRVICFNTMSSSNANRIHEYSFPFSFTSFPLQGATISLIVIASTGCASFSLPAAHLQTRVLLSACAGALSVFSSVFALHCFSGIQLQVDMAVTMVSAAAISVAAASAWATAILVSEH